LELQQRLAFASSSTPQVGYKCGHALHPAPGWLGPNRHSWMLYCRSSSSRPWSAWCAGDAL
jgi:hypothetical protein